MGMKWSEGVSGVTSEFFLFFKLKRKSPKPNPKPGPGVHSLVSIWLTIAAERPRTDRRWGSRAVLNLARLAHHDDLAG